MALPPPPAADEGGRLGGGLMRILSLPVAPVFHLLRKPHDASASTTEEEQEAADGLSPEDVTLRVDDDEDTGEDPLGLVIDPDTSNTARLTTLEARGPAMLPPAPAQSEQGSRVSLSSHEPGLSAYNMRHCARHLNEQHARFFVYRKQRQYHEQTIPRFRLKAQLAEEAARKSGNARQEQESGGYAMNE